MRRLILVVVSLWVVWAVRAHAILAMPAFVDESLHIMRAQVVYEFTDEKASFLPAKLLLYYYLGLFTPQDHNALWLTRQALALMSPLAAALSFALTYSLTGSYWKGVFVIWLHGFTPLLIFFDRLAMSDPFVMMFCAWSCLGKPSLCPPPYPQTQHHHGFAAWIGAAGEINGCPTCLCATTGGLSVESCFCPANLYNVLQTLADVF